VQNESFYSLNFADFSCREPNVIQHFDVKVFFSSIQFVKF